jgi:hypothetical protein
MNARPLLLLAALPLTGCVSMLPNVVTPDASSLEAGRSAPASTRAGKPLNFAVFYVTNPTRFGQRVADALRARGVSAEAVSSEHGLPPHVDVLLRVTYKGNGVVTEAYAASSGRKLVTIQDQFWTLKSFDDNLANALNAQLGPGTDLYALARAEKSGPEAPAGTAGAPGAAALGSEQIAAIVKATLEGAKASAPAAKPAAVSSDADSPRYKKAARPDDFAVVIGIDGYSDLPSATYAERDAQAVKAHLLALGYPERNVALLLGAKAGRASVAKMLETWLANNVSERSTVFVYYSGHGAPDPKTGEAYLVPWDGDPQFLEDTAYPIKRLYAKLSGLKAKRSIVALDACFSGSGGRSVLAKGLRPLVAKVELKPDAAKVVSLTAAEGGQVTGTLDEQGHGLFTYYLLRGLNGAAKDAEGRVTLRGLHEYLTPNVQDGARRQNRDQTPQLLGAPALAGLEP